MRRLVLAGIVLGLALAPCSCSSGRAVSRQAVTTTTTSGTSTTVAGPPTTAPAREAPSGVTVTTETFVDATRPTPPNGDAPAGPTRVITTTIWSPSGRDEPRPLVLFVHGFANRPDSYAALLEGWAAAGYLVAAPAIPVLNADAPGGPSERDLDEAPRDVSFVLDELLRRDGTRPGGRAIDPSRIAVTGHSDGEIVAFALGDDPCCRDPRVRSVVALAGLLGTSGPAPLTTGVPVLHVIADHDRYSDYDATLAFDRDQLPGPKLTVALRDAEHEPPFVDPSDPHFGLVQTVTLAFLDATLRDAADAADRIDAAVAGAPAVATLAVREWPGEAQTSG